MGLWEGKICLKGHPEGKTYVRRNKISSNSSPESDLPSFYLMRGEGQGREFASPCTVILLRGSRAALRSHRGKVTESPGLHERRGKDENKQVSQTLRLSSLYLMTEIGKRWKKLD